MTAASSSPSSGSPSARAYPLRPLRWILITIGQGLILGETISALGRVGIALVALSLFFVKGKKTGDTVPVTTKWVVTIGLSVLFAGIFGILQRYRQVRFAHAYDREFMMPTLRIAATILFAIGIVRDGGEVLRVIRHGGLWAVGAGISNGTTNALTLYVYTPAPMSFVAPTSAGAGILISFLISKIIFKEKFTVLQYLGVLIGGVALVLFQL